MNFVVLTIFPEMFDPFWSHGIVRRAIENKKIIASAVNVRDYAQDRHQVTDDRPYGGGQRNGHEARTFGQSNSGGLKKNAGGRHSFVNPPRDGFSIKIWPENWHHATGWF